MPSLSATHIALVIVAALVVIVPAAVFLMAPHRRRERALNKTVRQISKDTLRNLVVPDGVEGEIHIDSLLLTPRGLLVLEIKRVEGTVFGGERLDNWTAIDSRRRVTFANPIALMRKRVIALREQYAEMPVDGRVVFVGDVKLSSDLPACVTTVTGLREEFAQSGGRADGVLIDAFYPKWDELRRSRAA